ncbi:MAG TPA: hypothetical protein VFG69_20745 [Nannocystaceae bacterium]|nr:hypothetical protein [Nannocystaceae bacterium]
MLARLLRTCALAATIAGCGGDDPAASDPTLGSSSAAADDADAATTRADSTGASSDAPDDEGSTSAASTGADGALEAGSSDGSTGADLPDFDEIPWSTGDEIGYGIAYKDMLDPDAHSVFIGYAGYPFPLDASQSWVRELWYARLRELGVRHVYAVQGPADVPYSQLEIGNSHIATALTTQLGDGGFVLVAAHSSGTYVAHELLGQLVDGFDPQGVTAGNVVYFNLDGGLAGFDDAIGNHTRRSYFVSAFDGSTGSGAANRDAMQYAGDMWSAYGGYVELDASASGCNAGAQWCLHMVVINQLPHDPWDSSVDDYYDFVDRPVVTEYIDVKAADAGLGP